MNCPDCRDRLQQWLDGRTRDATAAPGELPALCPACAEWAAAARRFDQGLRLLNSPVPPPLLADRVVARIRARRRLRRHRLLFAAGAVAAALLVAIWHGRQPVAPVPAPPALVQTPGPAPAPPQASLRDSVAEAGSAVASLTSRTADETLAETKGILPVVSEPSLNMIDLQPPPLDPPAKSLREAGEGVTAGLEPVADSARRAVGLFFRELPPMDARPKTGF